MVSMKNQSPLKPEELGKNKFSALLNMTLQRI